MTKQWLGAALCAGMLMPAVTVRAQQDQKATISGPTQAADASGMTVDQLLPLTVHEAWVQSGRNEDKFFAMVRQLAEFSAQKRGITLPENAAAGQKAGAEIKRLARKDPDQLLYAVVDQAVVTVSGKTPAATTASATK